MIEKLSVTLADVKAEASQDTTLSQATDLNKSSVFSCVSQLIQRSLSHGAHRSQIAITRSLSPILYLGKNRLFGCQILAFERGGRVTDVPRCHFTKVTSGLTPRTRQPFSRIRPPPHAFHSALEPPLSYAGEFDSKGSGRCT
jgi:hypothetical protein